MAQVGYELLGSLVCAIDRRGMSVAPDAGEWTYVLVPAAPISSIGRVVRAL
ncbi:hypothetical protein [Mesorhizobium sp. 113-3-3]|uniref:hypothetical protein n=1 Tax=Mesorhizobium sp. 113-3-3 TaxID=2744516 RepID=UPI001928F74F|nr:hypothetical protein [Mesorhizobium sp. 113-3-3]